MKNPQNEYKMRLGHIEGRGFVGIYPPPPRNLFEEGPPENAQISLRENDGNSHLEISFSVDGIEAIKKMARVAFIKMYDIGETNSKVDSQIIELEPDQLLF